MAKIKDSKVIGDVLVRIGVQADELCSYIFDKRKNKGKIRLLEIKKMSNVIVSYIKLLEEIDKNGIKEDRKPN